MALPPLSAIRVFEAAARHVSFTRAAAELAMTQAAVSYQVKLLENRLGVALFERQPRRLALSEAGARLAPGVVDAFVRLNDAFAAVHERAETILSISAVSTLAANWLAPRLGGFQLTHPTIAVRLDTAPELVDLAHDYDVAIRSGRGEWPGLRAHRLLPLDLTPMCSPAALNGLTGAMTPARLLELPLLDCMVDWRKWFALAGVPIAERYAKSRVELQSQYMLGAMAAAGHGVALLNPAFFAADLASGRLVQPFPIVLRDCQDYWLVYQASRANTPKIKAFRGWIVEQAALQTNDAAPERSVA